jgi:hypothetical protein
MKTLYPQLRLTNPNFKYTKSAQTDIRETFRRFATQNQDNNKPLVEPILNPGGFVLSAEWFEMELKHE